MAPATRATDHPPATYAWEQYPVPPVGQVHPVVRTMPSVTIPATTAGMPHTLETMAEGSIRPRGLKVAGMVPPFPHDEAAGWRARFLRPQACWPVDADSGLHDRERPRGAGVAAARGPGRGAEVLEGDRGGADPRSGRGHRGARGHARVPEHTAAGEGVPPSAPARRPRDRGGPDAGDEGRLDPGLRRRARGAAPGDVGRHPP